MNHPASLVCVITGETRPSQGVARMMWLTLCVAALRLGGTSFYFQEQEVFTFTLDILIHYTCVGMWRKANMHVHMQTLLSHSAGCFSNQANF